MYMQIPGLRLVYPSTPADAKGLLKTLLNQNDAAIFFEHRLLYKVKGEVPEGDYCIPLGVADIKRPGKDVTIVAIGYQVLNALSAAEQLSAEGIDVEVIDPRTLAPFDKETFLKSVAKTGRLVVVEEGHKTGGVGAELAAIVAEEGIYYLEAPIKRVAALDVPIPYSPPMESFVLPSVEKIIRAVRDVLVD
jgi:pyruvate dehydrogenase E1 component beta subunit